MRILYLNPCGQMGGAETSLVSLMASIREARPDWELCLAVGEDGPLVGKARQMGVQVFVIPFPAAIATLGDAGQRRSAVLRAVLTSLGPAAAYARRLGKLIRNLDPAVIHSNGFKMHVLGSLVRPPKTALIWHMHDYASARPLMGTLLRPFQGRCDTVIANSKSVAADLAGLYPAVQVATIYNAIDIRRFAPQGETCDLDKASGLSPSPAGTVRVGLVATFARWKGHEVFLRALSLVPRELGIRGYVIGGPIYQTSGSQYSLAELERMAEQWGLRDRVGFTGFLDDPADAMRSLDILVHASTKPEPFGMAIIEGMACGKAVIASQAGGADELFADGINALGHAPGDFRQLARQIEKLARDEQLRLRLGRAARAAAEEGFQGHRLAAELVPLYERIADHTNRGQQPNAHAKSAIRAAVSPLTGGGEK
ncbi:MAG TPA: glycosyltransferase [Bryobacteraceae bacterium]|nr:glycosyltransferase [Bryobacteraceae bacterium]